MSGSEFLVPTIPLTEPERRRVEFAGGSPVVLPDGNPWRFYQPMPVERAERADDGSDRLMIAWDFGADLPAETNDALGRGFQRVLAKIDRAGNDADRLCGILEAAWLLLARNYVIEPSEFEELLLRGARDDAETRNRMYAALRGIVTDTLDRLGRWVVERRNQEVPI